MGTKAISPQEKGSADFRAEPERLSKLQSLKDGPNANPPELTLEHPVKWTDKQDTGKITSEIS